MPTLVHKCTEFMSWSISTYSYLLLLLSQALPDLSWWETQKLMHPLWWTFQTLPQPVQLCLKWNPGWARASSSCSHLLPSTRRFPLLERCTARTAGTNLSCHTHKSDHFFLSSSTPALHIPAISVINICTWPVSWCEFGAVKLFWISFCVCIISFIDLYCSDPFSP